MAPTFESSSTSLGCLGLSGQLSPQGQFASGEDRPLWSQGHRKSSTDAELEEKADEMPGGFWVWLTSAEVQHGIRTHLSSRWAGESQKLFPNT